MLQILLIGVIHDYQFDRYFTDDKIRRDLYEEQRNIYQKWIREKIGSFAPLLIFDEMNLVCDKSSNYRLEDTNVLWVYMDIPEAVRIKFGITADRSCSPEWIKEIDEPREAYWQMVIENISKACKIEKAIVICGLAHLPSFAKNLEASGHQIEIKNIRDEPWIDESWHKPLA